MPPSISKSLASQLGILHFLANGKKIASNNLATNLAFLGTWQILGVGRANMRARKQLASLSPTSPRLSAQASSPA